MFNKMLVKQALLELTAGVLIGTFLLGGLWFAYLVMEMV